MMRLWKQSYARPRRMTPAATLSTGLHIVIIGASVMATRPVPGVPPESLANRVYYIPPIQQRPGPGPVREVVRFVTLAQGGGGVGEGVGPRTMGDEKPVSLDETPGQVQRDTVVEDSLPAPVGRSEDSVFTVVDVDTAVVRSANSAAPTYPLSLLQEHIVGTVSAQYVVDTTGLADTTSFRVLEATRPEFAEAVRAALPRMRFEPAKIGNIKVRQVVRQRFTFRIAEPDTVSARASRP